MKLLGIPLLFLSSIIVFSLIVDMMLMNLSFRLAVKNLLNPFLVMDPFERAFLYYFLASMFFFPLYSAYRIKKGKGK